MKLRLTDLHHPPAGFLFSSAWKHHRLINPPISPNKKAGRIKNPSSFTPDSKYLSA